MKPGVASHLQVGAQLAGVAATVWPLEGPGRLPAAALALFGAGLALGAWTLAHNRIGNFGIYPEPRASARLVTTGPYAHVRHPMYGALMLVMLGAAFWNGHAISFAGLALVVAAVTAKAMREERLLGARFGEYAAYRRRTRWFVPYLL